MFIVEKRDLTANGEVVAMYSFDKAKDTRSEELAVHEGINELHFVSWWRGIGMSKSFTEAISNHVELSVLLVDSTFDGNVFSEVLVDSTFQHS